jgi:hypothetical protein
MSETIFATTRPDVVIEVATEEPRVGRVLAWREPPPKRLNRNPRDRALFVERLKSRPGRWAQYKPGHPHCCSAATILRRDYPGVEATTRRIQGSRNKVDVYARWVP